MLREKESHWQKGDIKLRLTLGKAETSSRNHWIGTRNVRKSRQGACEVAGRGQWKSETEQR